MVTATDENAGKNAQIPEEQGEFFKEDSFSNSCDYLRPKIPVFGVGGAGGNAVNNMIRSNLEGVDFVVANTDAQALLQSLCERRIQLGLEITGGLGAGARPDVGRASAEERDWLSRYGERQRGRATRCGRGSRGDR